MEEKGLEYKVCSSGIGAGYIPSHIKSYSPVYNNVVGAPAPKEDYTLPKSKYKSF